MHIWHGTIITCDDNNTVAKYLVEREGRIVFVGNDLPDAYRNAQITELGEKAIIPAFADAFLHYSSYSILKDAYFAVECVSADEFITNLRKHIEKTRDNPIIGFGAPVILANKNSKVCRSQLDAISPERPVCLITYDSHGCIVNTAFLNMVKNAISGLRGYHEETGEMREKAFVACMEVINRTFNTRRVIDAMMRNTDTLAEQGVGMIISGGGIGYVRDLDSDMEKSAAMGLDNGISMKVGCASNDVERVIKKGFKTIICPNIDGPVGSLEACVIQPYMNGEKGIRNIDREALREYCIKANRAGLQIVLRAHGDSAFDDATFALESALLDYPRKNHRHTIVHANMVTTRGLNICAKYGIYLSVHPGKLPWQQLNESAFVSENLGEDRQFALNPVNRIIKAGVKVCFASGAPSMEPRPLDWIYNVVNSPNSNGELSVMDAFRMATINGYEAAFLDDERGSLEFGKVCDMNILNINPLLIRPEDLSNVKVEQLYIAGKPYEHTRSTAMATLLRGMFPQRV